MNHSTTKHLPAHLDVLIIGAGISGIGAARAVSKELSGRSWGVLEARTTSGGTWDLFRYPGIRSDSDLYTFGYDFRPWRDDNAIASADSILGYLRDTARAEGVDAHITYGKRVVSADWQSSEGLWRVSVEDVDSGDTDTMTCTWIFNAAGYYRYDEGYSPEIPGLNRFRGETIHPQHWPQKASVAGRRVVVIGSGATAVTLVPSLADDVEHITMLQRTPTYIMALPKQDQFSLWARRVFGDKRGHQIARQKSIFVQRVWYGFCRTFPGIARRVIRAGVKAQLPKDYPVDVHFNPPYDPWDQRLCIVPDGDFFAAIRSGKASVVTDRIAEVREHDILLESGDTLDADVIVTATGLNLQYLGGVKLSLDGEPVTINDKVAYRGLMLDGVPNFVFAIGYTNASWTLRIGLIVDYFVRLVRLMDENGWNVVSARLPGVAMETEPIVNFDAGYVRRGRDTMPRQGDRAPWKLTHNYYADAKLLRKTPVQDGSLDFDTVVATELVSS